MKTEMKQRYYVDSVMILLWFRRNDHCETQSLCKGKMKMKWTKAKRKKKICRREITEKKNTQQQYHAMNWKTISVNRIIYFVFSFFLRFSHSFGSFFPFIPKWKYLFSFSQDNILSYVELNNRQMNNFLFLYVLITLSGAKEKKNEMNVYRNSWIKESGLLNCHMIYRFSLFFILLQKDNCYS